MNTDLRDSQRFSVQERLIISALMTAVSLWIRVVEILPDSRQRG